MTIPEVAYEPKPLLFNNWPFVSCRDFFHPAVKTNESAVQPERRKRTLCAAPCDRRMFTEDTHQQHQKEHLHLRARQQIEDAHVVYVLLEESDKKTPKVSSATRGIAQLRLSCVYTTGVITKQIAKDLRLQKSPGEMMGLWVSSPLGKPGNEHPYKGKWPIQLAHEN